MQLDDTFRQFFPAAATADASGSSVGDSRGSLTSTQDAAAARSLAARQATHAGGGAAVALCPLWPALAALIHLVRSRPLWSDNDPARVSLLDLVG